MSGGLGVRRYVCDNSAFLAIAEKKVLRVAMLPPSPLKSADGLMKRKHTLKKGGAVGAMPPTHYLSKPGWGGGGAGECHIQGPGPAAPPPPPRGLQLLLELMLRLRLLYSLLSASSFHSWI